MKKSFLIFLLMVFGFSALACGALVNSDSIAAMDSIDKQTLLIDVSVKKMQSGGSFTNFSLNKSLEELSIFIREKHELLQTTLYDNRFILIQKGSSLFLIEQIDKISVEKENRFCLFAPVGSFAIKNINGKLKDREYFYIPYHLLNNIEIQHYLGENADYESGLQCTAVGTIDEFAEFYDGLEQCSAERSGSTLTVTNDWTEYKLVLIFEDGAVTFTVKEVRCV